MGKGDKASLPKFHNPNSHTPVGVSLVANHRTRHLRFQENHRHRSEYVENSLQRVLHIPTAQQQQPFPYEIRW